MKRKIIVILIISLVLFGCEKPKKRIIKIAVVETNYGIIKFRFFDDVAPNTVRTFIELSKKGFYNGFTFYRIEKDSVIYGGLEKKEKSRPCPPIEEEFNYRRFEIGVVGLCRQKDKEKKDARSQPSRFFICLERHPEWENPDKPEHRYTAFGQVFEGMDVVRKIARLDVDEKQGPTEIVKIKKIYITDWKIE